jgi:hypothetical protein
MYIGLVAILTSHSSFPNGTAAKYFAVTAIKTIPTHVIISKSTELLGKKKTKLIKKIRCVAPVYRYDLET